MLSEESEWVGFPDFFDRLVDRYKTYEEAKEATKNPGCLYDAAVSATVKIDHKLPAYILKSFMEKATRVLATFCQLGRNPGSMRSKKQLLRFRGLKRVLKAQQTLP